MRVLCGVPLWLMWSVVWMDVVYICFGGGVLLGAVFSVVCFDLVWILWYCGNLLLCGG